jgi:hypothetical protein
MAPHTFRNRLVALTLAALSMSAVEVLAQATARDVARQALPSVVTIVTTNAQGQDMMLGSGFIVHENGVIVTNYHVIRDAAGATVRTQSNERYAVEGVLDADVEKDFAILKIKAVSLPALRLCNSDKIEPGDVVYALGSPLGLTGSVTTGNFSQLRDRGGYHMMQHSAPIDHGSSGGPLLLATGEVVGVNTSGKESNNSLNFALPINYVRASLQDWNGKLMDLKALTSYVHDAEEKAKQQAVASKIHEYFTEYRDPDNLFTVLVPRRWQMQRNVSTGQDGYVHVVVMGSPDDAQFAELNGWLSDGFRLHLTFPPKGRVWSSGGAAAWIGTDERQLMEGYTRSDLQGQDTVPIDGLQVRRLALTGIAPKLREPETGLIYHAFHPQGRAVVELVTPASKSEELAVVRTIFESSLKMNWIR